MMAHHISMLQDKKKKILLITYHFPPSSAIGGVRIASFTKYLPNEGWEPIVLTIQDSYVEHKDEALLDLLPPVAIYKTRLLPSINELYLKIKSLISKNWPARTCSDAISSHSNNNTFTKQSNQLKSIRNFIVALMAVPDEKRNWIIPATIKALHIIRREKIHYCLTSSPPYSTHIIGLLIKLIRKQTKWIADFRDPWMVPLDKRLYPTTFFSKAIDYCLENNVIRKADLVLTTTKLLADELSGYYRKYHSSKFIVVPNGFESEVCAFVDTRCYDIFTISYTGSFYVGRSPEPIFQAVSSLIKSKTISASDIRIKLVGNCRYIESIPTEEIIKKYDLVSVVEVIDPVPQTEAHRIIRQSHISLLLAPNQPYQIPAKTYEYIGLGTPILALTGEGATADLINSTEFGKAIHPDNIDSIKAYLIKEMNQKDSQKDQNVASLDIYTRRRSVQQLVQHINELEAEKP